MLVKCNGNCNWKGCQHYKMHKPRGFCNHHAGYCFSIGANCKCEKVEGTDATSVPGRPLPKEPKASKL